MDARSRDTAATPASLLKALHGSNLALRHAPDGALQVTADTLELRHLVLHTPFGTADVTRATLAEARLRLAAGAAGGAPQLAGLAAASLAVDTAELHPQPPAAPAPGEVPELRLAPLATLQGRLVMCIRDARWRIDAEITLPVVAGRIDFDRVVVEHVGPNSSMGAAREGLYVEGPDRRRTPLVRFDAPDLPGVRYEQLGGLLGRGVTDRGSIDLHPLLEAVLRAVAAGAPPPVARPTGGDTGVLLGRTRLAGDLQLADGALGTARNHLVLAERAQGRNALALSASVLGQRLVLRLPELAASHAAFAWQGLPGRTGALSGSLDAHVTGLAGTTPAVALTLHRLTVHELRLGELHES